MQKLGVIVNIYAYFFMLHFFFHYISPKKHKRLTITLYDLRIQGRDVKVPIKSKRGDKDGN